MRRGTSHQSQGKYKQDRPNFKRYGRGAYDYTRNPGAKAYVALVAQRKADAEQRILDMLDKGFPLRCTAGKVYFGKELVSRKPFNRLVAKGVLVADAHESTRYVRPGAVTLPLPSVSSNVLLLEAAARVPWAA